MIVEASQTDGGGHSNNIEQSGDRVIGFDHAGKSNEIQVDENKETLVVVLGDHETGGLTLLDGSLKDGLDIWQF